MAYTPIIYIVYNKMLFNILKNKIFLFGIICLFISENCNFNSKIISALAHSLWHISAYHTIYLFFINEL